MDSPDAALYLQKIEELVYDNGEIITPTSISAKWDIKVQDARSLIEQFLKDTRSLHKNDMAATYVLIGVNQDDKTCLQIVKEDDLEEKKKQLKSVISEVIYSLQKSKDIELNSLAILEPIGYSMRDKPLLGSIVCKDAVKRKLKKNVIEVKKNDMQKEVKKEETKDIKIDVKGSTKTNNKNGLSNFVTKNAISQMKPIEPKPKPKNLMANFLSNKQPSKENVNENKNRIKENQIEPVVKEQDDSPKEATKTEPVKHKLIDSDSDESIVEVKKPKVTTPKKNTKKRSAKDKGNKSSKRRRIIKNDSDSDDMFESDHEKTVEDDDIVVSEEEPPPKPLPSKRKVKKAVTETTTDDDGYIVTVNKNEYESASGEENDEPNNQTVKNKEAKIVVKDNKVQDNGSKKKTSPKGGKTGKGKMEKSTSQKQITSFFIKK